jgi:four helix bundle protein
MNIKRFEYLEIWKEARGSTGEVRSQSYRAFDNKYITEAKLNELLERTDSLSRKTYNLMQHLKNSDIKGLKYL